LREGEFNVGKENPDGAEDGGTLKRLLSKAERMGCVEGAHGQGGKGDSQRERKGEGAMRRGMWFRFLTCTTAKHNNFART